ncbi:hypothetical protein D3C78_1823640 [compost metagenome]
MRQGGAGAQKINQGGAVALQRHAVAGNGKPFATLQPLRQVQHDGRIQFADLNHAQPAARFTQQAVEVDGMLAVHQNV